MVNQKLPFLLWIGSSLASQTTSSQRPRGLYDLVPLRVISVAVLLRMSRRYVHIGTAWYTKLVVSCTCMHTVPVMSLVQCKCIWIKEWGGCSSTLYVLIRMGLGAYMEMGVCLEYCSTRIVCVYMHIFCHWLELTLFCMGKETFSTTPPACAVCTIHICCYCLYMCETCSGLSQSLSFKPTGGEQTQGTTDKHKLYTITKIQMLKWTWPCDAHLASTLLCSIRFSLHCSSLSLWPDERPGWLSSPPVDCTQSWWCHALQSWGNPKMPIHQLGACARVTAG